MKLKKYIASIILPVMLLSMNGYSMDNQQVANEKSKKSGLIWHKWMDKCLGKGREFTIEFRDDESIDPNIKQEFQGKKAVVHTKLSKDVGERPITKIVKLPCFIFNDALPHDVVFQKDLIINKTQYFCNTICKDNDNKEPYRTGLIKYDNQAYYGACKLSNSKTLIYVMTERYGGIFLGSDENEQVCIGKLDLREDDLKSGIEKSTNNLVRNYFTKYKNVINDNTKQEVKNKIIDGINRLYQYCFDKFKDKIEQFFSRKLVDLDDYISENQLGDAVDEFEEKYSDYNWLTGINGIMPNDILDLIGYKLCLEKLHRNNKIANK